MAHIGVDSVNSRSEMTLLHQNSFTVCRLAADGSEAFETYQLAVADLDPEITLGKPCSEKRELLWSASPDIS